MPTVRSDALMFVFNRALDTLGRWLEIRDRGLSQLRVRMDREDGGPASTFEIGLARAGFDRSRLLELLQLKLDGLKPGGDIDAIKLDADSTAERRPAQSDLLSGINRNDAWPALLDRLSARLGTSGLSSLAPIPRSQARTCSVWARSGDILTARNAARGQLVATRNHGPASAGCTCWKTRTDRVLLVGRSWTSAATTG